MVKAKAKNTDEVRVYCSGCGKDRILRDFYQSNKEAHNNDIFHKKYPICKLCIKKEIYKETGQVDKVKFKETLHKLDLPFKNSVYLNALNSGKETFGTYISLLNTAYRNNRDNMNWGDSDAEEGKNIKKENNNQANNEKLHEDEFSRLSDKWGFGYNNDELIAFEKKYQQLKNNYSEKTAMHTEALLTYIRYRVKEEIATAKGDVKEAKDWAEMANKAATNAKINPSQLSKADLSEGLSTFSELSQAVEKEVDIIPILPRFKYRPNDALDFNIWCYVNYERDLAGLPPCKYEDLYAFYDKRKQDYVEQYGDPYGIFTGDTSESNRENIKKFIEEKPQEGEI